MRVMPSINGLIIYIYTPSLRKQWTHPLEHVNSTALEGQGTPKDGMSLWWGPTIMEKASSGVIWRKKCIYLMNLYLVYIWYMNIYIYQLEIRIQQMYANISLSICPTWVCTPFVKKSWLKLFVAHTYSHRNVGYPLFDRILSICFLPTGIGIRLCWTPPSHGNGSFIIHRWFSH